MSLADTMLSVFPPPTSLAMPAAGVDISEGSIKFVSLADTANGQELKSYGPVPLPEGAVVGGDIEEPSRVVEALRFLRLRQGVKYANACLPERKAYLYQTVVPSGARDARAAVEFDLESHVPLPPGEVRFDFEEVRRIEAGTIVSVTAYAKRMIEAYSAVFRDAGIALRALEVESQSLARGVLGARDSDRTIMIVDVGKRATRIAIAENRLVVFTATLDVGGDTLASAIGKQFGVSMEEAEKIKNGHGFLMSRENREVVETLMITVSVIKDEIAKHLSYWNRPPEGSVPRRPVEKAVLCGGNANLLGFAEYLEGFVGVPVSIADVWTNAFSLHRYVPHMPFHESLEYAGSIGLAIRGSRNRLW